MIFAIIITSTFTLFLQNSIAKSNTNSVLELNINDVKSDISDASNKNLLAITRKIATLIDAEPEITNDMLLKYATEHGITEIDIINTNGIISLSTNPSFIGFDMASGSQSKEFLVLLNGTKEFVQSYQPTTYDATIYRKYGGVALDAGGFVQVGYNAEQFQKDLAETTKNITKNRHVGSTGCVIIVDKNMSLVSGKENYEGNVFNQSEFSGALPVNTKFFTTVYNDKCYCMYDIVEGYYIIAALPVEEANLSRNLAIYITVFMELVVFVGLFILIYFLIKTLVVKNIQKVNASLAEITGGNLDVTVDVRTNEEFSSLSDDINSTVVTLKRYIAEAAARIDKELEFAKSIQHSALPSIFPPYPNRKDFDIYALMNPAKEVGGDFYDFYFTETNELVLIVADVSGKGIPGAMFMMRAKTLIKSLASTGIGVDEILTQANDNLCTGNDAEMFVTAWICIINCLTGHAEFSNAGHNPPLLKKFNEKAFYLPMKPGFVLGGMEGIHYKKFEFNLNPSDLLFVYTDGVTESTNEQNELYGEDRLIKAFEQNASKDVKKICNSIQTDVDKFVDVAPQFDDITMLCFQYHGNQIENKENK